MYYIFESKRFDWNSRSRHNDRHFADVILKCILMISMLFGSNFIEICCSGSNLLQNGIGLSNGFAPNQRQTTTLNGVDQYAWRHKGTL